MEISRCVRLLAWTTRKGTELHDGAHVNQRLEKCERGISWYSTRICYTFVGRVLYCSDEGQDSIQAAANAPKQPPLAPAPSAQASTSIDKHDHHRLQQSLQSGQYHSYARPLSAHAS
jgi:hypothetical protein